MNYDLWRIPPQDIESEQIEGTRWDPDQGRWITEDFEDDGPQQQPDERTTDYNASQFGPPR